MTRSETAGEPHRISSRDAIAARYRVLAMLGHASPALLVAMIVLTLANGFLPIATLTALGRMTGDIPAAVTHGLSSADGTKLIAALAAAGGFYVLSLLCGPAEDALSAAVGARMTAGLQSRLIAAVSAPVGIDHLEDPKTLDQLSSAQGELVSADPSAAAMMIAGRFGDRLAGLLACVVVGTFRWWLGLGLFAMWMTLRWPLRRLVTARASTFRGATEPLRRAQHFLRLAWRASSAKEMRIFGLGPWAVAEHERLYSEAMWSSWRSASRVVRRVTPLSVVVLAGLGITVGMLTSAAYHGALGLGGLVVMLTMIPTTMQVGTIGGTDVSLEMMLSSLPDLDALTRSLRATAPGGVLPAAGLPAREIRFENVTFRYPHTDANVLDGLDLVLPAGSSTAIVGLNGAGKTTLVTLLARLREPTDGRIVVDGMPLESLDPRRWQRQVAAVFQDYVRLPLSARENVALLDGDGVDEEALERVMAKAGALDLIGDLPGGWDTILAPSYEDGQDLSGGQWQRVALARALYAVERGARVLVLDEPTAQLDVRAEASFYDRFLEITEGVTSIVISHRFSTVRRADQIAVLDGGRITEIGDHETLIARGGTYAEMFALQVARFGGGRQ